MISGDRNVLVPASPVSERMKEYGAMVGELHIILMCDKSHAQSLKIENSKLKISDNVWVYPTNSFYKIFRPIDAARLGKRIVLEKKFVRGRSLITCQDMESGWAGLRIKNKWRIPLELQMHTDLFSPYFGSFQNSVRKFFMRRIINGADSIRVVSENLKSKVLNIRPEANVYVLPIYIDKNRIENAQIKFDLHARYPWQFILLSVARLAPEKNLGLAIESLALVRQRFPNTGLIIVGSGSEAGSLKQKAGRLNLEGAVEFAGWQDDLASFYKTANVFVQTSLYEGYGLALVEAGLSGLLVVTTPVGIADEFEDGKDLFLCTTAGQFAGRIIELIESNQKRENLRFNLKKTLEAKLLSKEVYLEALQAEWGRIAGRIR